MKVLLDTNIIIDRESHNTRNYTIGLLFKWIDKLKYTKYIHPKTREELLRYKDKQILEALLIKLDSYETLIVDDDYTNEFRTIVSKFALDENSLVDNSLLYQIVLKRADLLITEDKIMHQKARELGIEDKVFTINRFVTKVTEENPEFIDYKMLSVSKTKFGVVNLSDVFFDSFRSDYKEFNDWFNSKANEEAYICRINDKIVGFLYLKVEGKEENYHDINPVFRPAKRLKVGAFKVESTGFRLGERFLKIIFDNAKNKNVEEIYVTLFEDNQSLERLRNLLERWGFQSYGNKATENGDELVLLKKMNVYDFSMSPKENFPNINLHSNKYVLPIYPKFHTSLFPDGILRTEKMELYMDNLAHRYALQKVYVSSADVSNVNRGDIVLIYRTGDKSPKKYSSVITTIAIIDQIVVAKTLNELLNECQNRSVFSKEELASFWPKYSKVIKLIEYKTLTKKITLDGLYMLRVLEQPNGPRPFHLLTDLQFSNILKQTNTTL